MPEFSQVLKPAALRARLITSIIIASVLMSTDYYYALSRTLYPAAGLVAQTVNTAAALPSQLIRTAQKHFQDVKLLIEQNQNLREQLLQSQHHLQILNATLHENRRLRKLAKLDIFQHSPRSLIAQVIRTNTQSMYQQQIINRGSLDNIYVGQPVLDAHGIVGQISKVSPFQSSVLLITDPGHSILVRNARTGDRYLAQGDDRRLKLRYIPPQNDLIQGDTMLTSGLDETYPPEYIIGTVTKLVTLPGRDFLEANVEVSAEIHRNREVLLIWHSRPESEKAEHAP